MRAASGREHWMWLWGGLAAVVLAGATGGVIKHRTTPDNVTNIFQIDFVEEDIHVRVEMISPDDPAVAAGPPARHGRPH